MKEEKRMLEVHALGYKDDKAAVTYIAHDSKASLMLANLFECFIESWAGVEVDIVRYADQMPLDTKVTAIYDKGQFGWTWEKPNADKR